MNTSKQREKTIGVLKLNTRFPRLLGDIGNAESFRYPVNYCTIESAIPANVTVADDLPESLQHEFLAAALKLIDQNVSIITTTCGFLSTMQVQLADLSSTPAVSYTHLTLPTNREV